MPSGSKKRRRSRTEDVQQQEEDQENHGTGNQSLPVAILPDDFDGIPLDGAQYLAVVRREAKAAPSIVRDKVYSSIDDILYEENVSRSRTESAAGQEGLEIAYEQHILPSNEWKKNFSQKFKNMRESIRRNPVSDPGITHSGLPNSKSSLKWYKFLHGTNPNPIGNDDVIDEEEEVEGEAEQDLNNDKSKSNKATHISLRMPKSSLLQRFRMIHIMTLLSNFSIWLDQDWYRPQAIAGNVNSNKQVIEPFHSQWLFALLAHLDGNLIGDDVSTLRQLTRSCISRISKSRKVSKGELNMENELGAWIIVCAVTEVWGQTDLWKDAEEALCRLT